MTEALALSHQDALQNNGGISTEQAIRETMPLPSEDG